MKLNKKRLIMLLLFIAIVIPFSVTLSKYIHDFMFYHLSKANNFFFNSDKLTNPGTRYSINNWNGLGEVVIQFELNNHKNNILTSDSDITYNIVTNCDRDVTCSLNSSSGTLYKEELTHSFELSVIPSRAFNSGESIEVKVNASSILPYTETLSATFQITVGKQGISYEITDTRNQAYLNFAITNALEQYTCMTAGSGHSVGEIISTDAYKALPSSEKALFASARITLTFDPREILLDTTGNIMDIATVVHTSIDGVQYINSLTFDVDAASSTYIRFYKNDISMDYTYPIINDNSVININIQS